MPLELKIVFGVFALLFLVSLIVFPDKILDWIADKTGRSLTRFHIVIIEVLAIGLLVLMMIFILPICYKLDRLTPPIMLVILGVMRLCLWLSTQISGSDDD